MPPENPLSRLSNFSQTTLFPNAALIIRRVGVALLEQIDERRMQHHRYQAGRGCGKICR